jgi:hypothetical protein
MLDHIIATEEAKEAGDSDKEIDFENALRDDPSPVREGYKPSVQF